MIILHPPAYSDAAVTIQRAQYIAERHPGSHRLEIRVLSGQEGAATRTVRIGSAWRYDASAACVAALSALGRVEVTS